MPLRARQRSLTGTLSVSNTQAFLLKIYRFWGVKNRCHWAGFLRGHPGRDLLPIPACAGENRGDFLHSSLSELYFSMTLQAAPGGYFPPHFIHQLLIFLILGPLFFLLG